MNGILFTPENIQATVERRKTVTRRLAGLKEINKEPDKWVYKGIDQQQMFWFQCNDPIYNIHLKPRYHAGEIVYIKEAWRVVGRDDTEKHFRLEIQYKDYSRKWCLVDYVTFCKYTSNSGWGTDSKWRSPLFMPAWAARYFLKIISVRPERLQEITEEDALKEGCIYEKYPTWWQGYRKISLGELGIELLHQDMPGDAPPDWMIEPHRRLDRPDLDRTARRNYIWLWDSINKPPYDWEANPWVWRYEYALTEKEAL